MSDTTTEWVSPLPDAPLRSYRSTRSAAPRSDSRPSGDRTWPGTGTRRRGEPDSCEQGAARTYRTRCDPCSLGLPVRVLKVGDCTRPRRSTTTFPLEVPLSLGETIVRCRCLPHHEVPRR